MNFAFGNQIGFALGRLLFVVAFLTVVVSILAFKSGYFVSHKPDPDDVRKAKTLIQIGDSLKHGVDRVFKDNKVTLNAVDTNFSDTLGSNRLFSPTGGGIIPPSWTMAVNPSSDGTAAKGDIWYFPQAAVPGLGTGAPEMLAVLRIDRALCNEVNNQAIGIPTPPSADLGSFYMMGFNKRLFDAWPVALKGQTIGCVRNSNSDSRGNFFFEVLAIQ